MHLFFETNEPIRIDKAGKTKALHSKTYLFNSGLSPMYYCNTIYAKAKFKIKKTLELESIYEIHVIDWKYITSNTHPINYGILFL